MRREIWYGTAGFAAISLAVAVLNFPTNTVSDDADSTKETSVVQVFFGNNNLDPGVSCKEVFPVLRTIPKTQAVGQAAINELLIGPTDKERAAGYFTSLNPGVTIKSLRIASGTTYVDFGEALERGVSGSCRIAMIRWQIVETLRQFPTVQNVVVSIDGRTEDILQP
jgi:spore germination protein GerM